MLSVDLKQAQRGEIEAMFSSIAAKYDLANTVLSFGCHFNWRRALLRSLKPNPTGRGLDLCTGTGGLLRGLNERFGTVLGIDFSRPMLINGERTPATLLLQGDALVLPFPDRSIDAVTVAFGVRNYVDLEEGLAEIKRVLRSGGEVRILEFGQPPGVLFGALFRWYSAVVIPVIGSILTGNRSAYEYLPETSASFPSGAEFVDILKRFEFKEVTFRSLTFGIAYLYSAHRT